MSGVGITQEGSEEREYCFQVFHFSQPNVCEIHFVVTWNTEAHLSVSVSVDTQQSFVLVIKLYHWAGCKERISEEGCHTSLTTACRL